ncbi:hypothetical protein MNBD_ALPHA01-1312 [hydrothermal vent metagenome]|uniref:Uncharacterized protein n=1 Tax=hydrothermal vent metagenome TaxID=652676 RepID=A0A3B0TA99_9ZZZZ
MNVTTLKTAVKTHTLALIFFNSFFFSNITFASTPPLLYGRCNIIDTFDYGNHHNFTYLEEAIAKPYIDRGNKFDLLGFISNDIEYSFMVSDKDRILQNIRYLRAYKNDISSEFKNYEYEQTLFQNTLSKAYGLLARLTQNPKDSKRAKEIYTNSQLQKKEKHPSPITPSLRLKKKKIDIRSIVTIAYADAFIRWRNQVTFDLISKDVDGLKEHQKYYENLIVTLKTHQQSLRSNPSLKYNIPNGLRWMFQLEDLELNQYLISKSSEFLAMINYHLGKNTKDISTVQMALKLTDKALQSLDVSCLPISNGRNRLLKSQIRLYLHEVYKTDVNLKKEFENIRQALTLLNKNQNPLYWQRGITLLNYTAVLMGERVQEETELSDISVWDLLWK